MIFAVAHRALTGWVRLMPTGRSDGTAGFSYIGLLIAIVFFGFGSVGAARLLASTERAEREQDLLFIGEQFRNAIRSYVQVTGAAVKYPATLAELLQDSRFPTPRRHLRKLYIDPITGNAEWGLVMAPEGGIMGVYSLSTREPQKITGFPAGVGSFLPLPPPGPVQASPWTVPIAVTVAVPIDKAKTYQDWKFIYRP